MRLSFLELGSKVSATSQKGEGQASEQGQTQHPGFHSWNGQVHIVKERVREATAVAALYAIARSSPDVHISQLPPSCCVSLFA